MQQQPPQTITVGLADTVVYPISPTAILTPILIGIALATGLYAAFARETIGWLTTTDQRGTRFDRIMLSLVAAAATGLWVSQLRLLQWYVRDDWIQLTCRTMSDQWGQPAALGTVTDISFGIVLLFAFITASLCRSAFAVRASRLSRPLGFVLAAAIMASVGLQLYLVQATLKAAIDGLPYLRLAAKVKTPGAAQCYLSVAIDLLTCSTIIARLAIERDGVSEPVQAILIRVMTLAFSTACVVPQVRLTRSFVTASISTALATCIIVGSKGSTKAYFYAQLPTQLLSQAYALSYAVLLNSRRDLRDKWTAPRTLSFRFPTAVHNKEHKAPSDDDQTDASPAQV